MAKREQISTFSAVAFVVTTFVIAPAGWLIGQYVDANRQFRDKTEEQFQETDRKTEELLGTLIETKGTTDANTKDIDLIRERLDKMERRLYALSSKSPDNLIKMIRKDEGFRGRPYMDSEGLLTIGIGFCIDRAPLPETVGALLVRVHIGQPTEPDLYQPGCRADIQPVK